MEFQATTLSRLSVELTAHQDSEQKLLMAKVTADSSDNEPTRTPVQIAIVIDRSGSMSGDKIENTKLAVARFIRSLRPEDRVALVTYNDHANLHKDLL